MGKKTMILERILDKEIRDALDEVEPRHVSRHGLEALVKRNFIPCFEYITECVLETGEARHLPRKGDVLLPRSECQELVVSYARMGGWLRAMAKELRGHFHKEVELLLRSNYHWSSLIPEWDLVEHHPSPGALLRRIRKIRRIGRQLLAVHDTSPRGIDVVAAALLGHGNPRRAAIQAVAATLTVGHRPPSFREAREILADRSRWGVPG